MKIALVHDCLNEYGGAERVLEELARMYPEAPIYTAFFNPDSTAYQKFEHRKLIPSWFHYIPFSPSKLQGPLRFLAPSIWRWFDFSDYDVVISSSSWYITKGFRKSPRTKEICYCHTPPRWLYEYRAGAERQGSGPAAIYRSLVAYFMRIHDFRAAQKVDYFLANSEEVRSRIKKAYGRDATVIYPPVRLPLPNSEGRVESADGGRKDYYFFAARNTDDKGLTLALEVARELDLKLKIAGAVPDYFGGYQDLKKSAGRNVEFLGYVTDDELVSLYAEAKAFLALAENEDFGITPIEAMLCGTPVIAYFGGGYKETVIEAKTGVFFKEYSAGSLVAAIKKFEGMRITIEDCRRQAQKFSPEKFGKRIKAFVAGVV